MPLSIIIELEHDFPLPQEHFGRQAQGWFFNALKKINPDIAHRFHNTQPYTISTPFSDNPQESFANQNSNISLIRLTILNDDLKEFYLFSFLPKIETHLPLLWMDYKISSYVYSENIHPLAGFKPYAVLSDDYSFRFSRSVLMKFTSPTFFRSGDIDIPLPEPLHVYRSLLHSWNAFAPDELRIEEDWLYFAKSAIIINRFDDLKTERISLAGGQRGELAGVKRGALTGFTGSVKFSLIHKRKLSRLFQDYYAQGASIFNTLSAFAFYCGVGSKTTIGMGQTIPKILF
jgi:CRISPR-associated endoribonuclease Cas6